MKIVISANTSWNLINFRSGLIRNLIANGFEVVALAPEDQHSCRLADLGCSFVPIKMQNHGVSPIQDALLFLRFLGRLKSEKPSIYLGFTIKPNVYGSLAANMLGIPVINNIAGLGVSFSRNSWLRRVAETLYKLALKRSKQVFFQNEEDRDLFLERAIVRLAQVDVLPGSGVNTDHFSAANCGSGPADGMTFLLVSRLLWEKGLGEYIEVARRIRSMGLNAKFQVLGFLDEHNPTAISREVLESWVAEGVIEYLGATDDVRPYLCRADCVVLPSYYREGTPRSLLEAAAMGRPIVTTDWIGCRNVVDHGINGFLCAPRNPKDLECKLLDFMSLGGGEREAMGRASRTKAEAEFDESFVVGKYVMAIAQAVRMPNDAVL